VVANLLPAMTLQRGFGSLLWKDTIDSTAKTVTKEGEPIETAPYPKSATHYGRKCS